MKDNILSSLEQILASENSYIIAVENGERNSSLCAQCHGYDGNSSYPWVPNLASQNPVYLVQQSIKFRADDRKDHIMGDIIRSLTDKDLIDLAVYYSSRQLIRRGKSADPGVYEKGKTLYQKHCISCHGEDGMGNAYKNHAWLAGQQIEYIVRSLKRYRDRSHWRTHPVMETVTSSLSDQDIEYLASYLSGL